MSTKDTGGPAFPRPRSDNPNNGEMAWEQDGMTLRDWFAGMAFNAIHGAMSSEMLAELAYEIADAMLKERQK